MIQDQTKGLLVGEQSWRNICALSMIANSEVKVCRRIVGAIAVLVVDSKVASDVDAVLLLRNKNMLINPSVPVCPVVGTLVYANFFQNVSPMNIG